MNADPRTWPPEGRELLARILREAQRVAAERKRFDPRTTHVYGAK